jgi:hypothetical protein
MTDSLIPISDEQAKLGQEILKAFRGLGSFFEKALGSTPEDLVGYFGGDRLRVRRIENMARMMFEARERLTARGVEDTKPATLSIALPILQGAADEDREELVDLWARLLANAMDPKLNNVRHSFIDAVKVMDPPDALVLRYVKQNNVAVIAVGETEVLSSTHGIANIARATSFNADTIEVSSRHLLALSLFDQHQNNNYYLNALCREFLRACYPEPQP